MWTISTTVEEEMEAIMSNDTISKNGLIHVTTPFLLISATPLLGLALISWHMGLSNLSSPIVVGVLRTFVQLSILGAILHPIFHYGVEYYQVVVIYCIFMVLLASFETWARSSYSFKGMFSYILAAFLFNIGLVSLFAFGLILRPKPLWNPQYVIPIIGMLLGNCISGVALSMNAILVSLVEQSSEVELYMSFGASPQEATARLMREAVRVGAMPMLNNMAVIGLISIPGMMTGQILAGSSAMEAARYQMLILYLIAMCAFGTILSGIWVVRKCAFDHDDNTQMLQTDFFLKQKEKNSFFRQIAIRYNSLRSFLFHMEADEHDTTTLAVVNQHKEETQFLLAEKGLTTTTTTTTSEYYVAPKKTLEVIPMHHHGNGGGGAPSSSSSCPNGTHGSNLEIRQVSRSFKSTNNTGVDRILFSNISMTLEAGDIAAVRGPSGSGKSLLLRGVAGLSPMTSGEILLNGRSKSDYNLHNASALWRRQVRYVSQGKVDIPGTPRQLIQQISTFSSWRMKQQLCACDPCMTSMPSLEEMMTCSCRLIQKWGLESTFMDSEWKLLSGGEAQRIHVAIAIASRPRVLLLDESTSALDLDSKTRVEESVKELVSSSSSSSAAAACSEYHGGGCSVLWITHDEDQVHRIMGQQGR